MFEISPFLNFLLVGNSLLTILLIFNQNETGKDSTMNPNSSSIPNPLEQFTWVCLVVELVLLLIQIKSNDFWSEKSFPLSSTRRSKTNYGISSSNQKFILCVSKKKGKKIKFFPHFFWIYRSFSFFFPSTKIQTKSFFLRRKFLVPSRNLGKTISCNQKWPFA